MLETLAHPPAALALIIATAIALDAAVGDPAWLWMRIPHPIVGIGTVIGWADRRFNDPRLSANARRVFGGVAIVAIIALAAGAGWALCVLAASPFGWLPVSVICSVFLAQRSLFDHVDAVAQPLADEDLARARLALSHIVGRDTAALDAGEIAGAAIESLAENWSDGVGAPLFWFVLFGPAGLLGYKALNTADSMIGHRTERHAAFGFAAAKLDDLANWAPARLTGSALALASLWTPGASFRSAWAAMRRDAGGHRSPNAGWPEAACAGALDLAIGGPRRYGATVGDEPYMGVGGRPPRGTTDIRRALTLVKRSAPLLWIAAIGVALI